MADLSIATIGPMAGLETAQGAGKSGFLTEFADMLKNNMSDTNELLNKADTYIQEFTVSKTRDLHEVMIAAEQAGIALNYTMQIRNKLIESYQEIMRMQV